MGYRFSQYPGCKFVDYAEETAKLEYNYVILEFCLNWQARPLSNLVASVGTLRIALAIYEYNNIFLIS